MNLVAKTDHVCYVKLIVSGLDYGLESDARKILGNQSYKFHMSSMCRFLIVWAFYLIEKALTSAKTRNGRLYATQFMLVLLRAKIPNFENWGIIMLINQTKDLERCVVLAALEILDEACHEKVNLIYIK